MAVYSWGANSHGQLGLGFENELCSSPQRISRLPFQANSIKSIKGGGGHVLLLDFQGQLYSCGWNNKGQLGQAATGDKNELSAIPLDFFDGLPIEDFSAGWDNSAAITRDRKLYLWGSNSFQQLGLCKRGFAFVNSPQRVTLPRNEIPVKVSLGLRHCCVLTEENNVYVLGKFRVGETRGDFSLSKIQFNQTEVLKIQPEIPVKMLASGQNHVVMSDGSQVIAIGDNKFGQGNSFYIEDGIKQLTAGWTHNGVLTKSRKIQLWGRNSYGQIGCSHSENCPVPVELQLVADQNSARLHLGAEHGLVNTKGGEVFTWGWNEHGNCGNGGTENLFTAVQVNLPHCIVAGTGAGFCYAVCET